MELFNALDRMQKTLDTMGRGHLKEDTELSFEK